MGISTKYIFTGTVQGVFFRSRTCELAKFLGLSGYVKNLPDGTVEATIMGGSSELLERLQSEFDITNIQSTPSDETFEGFAVM